MTHRKNYNDTYITLAARNGMYVALFIGGLLLCGMAAYQAAAMDRQMAIEARV